MTHRIRTALRRCMAFIAGRSDKPLGMVYPVDLPEAEQAIYWHIGFYC
ncbi:hypothetical protein [Oceanibaculum pacificum]|nr:hypothetical protein [Oceanibaculum pacificum]